MGSNNNDDDSGSSSATDENDDEEQEEDPQAQKSATDTHVQLVSELRAFRKYAINRKKSGRNLRRFQSEVLPQAVADELNDRLSKAADADAVRDIFTEYMQDYQINFLAETVNLKKSLGNILK
jgi:hypothetical protein